MAEKSVAGLAHYNQNPFSPTFHLHVYGSSPQSESLEQATLEDGLRVSYKTILAIISQLCRAARKVSPDWSQKTMTCHSFDCFSIVWGSVGDFSSEQLLHDPNERTGKGENL